MAKSSPFSGVPLSDQVGLDQRLFSETIKPKTEKKPKAPPSSAPIALEKPAKADVPNQPELPRDLGDLSERGYTSHSYRFTSEELNWIELFCIQAAVRLGHKVPHNTLMRVLLRLAADEWKHEPENNRLLKLLSRLKV